MASEVIIGKTFAHKPVAEHMKKKEGVQKTFIIWKIFW